MVLSRQSSWLMLGVCVCSRAATRRAPCRRALPRGSSSTPMVVRIAAFCKHKRTAQLEPCDQCDHHPHVGFSLTWPCSKGQGRRCMTWPSREGSSRQRGLQEETRGQSG